MKRRPNIATIDGLGLRLQMARRHLGLKQEELAAHFGISLRAYTRCEALKGRRALSEHDIWVLRELGINLDWLIVGQGEMAPGVPGISHPPLPDFESICSIVREEIARSVGAGIEKLILILLNSVKEAAP